MNRKGLNAMSALLKFLVPLAIFLSGSYAHTFTNLSSVAENQARVNHLIRFEEPMSNPTNTERQVGTWQSLPELEIDPGDFSSDSSQAPNSTLHQDGEGEVYSEAVSTNVESPHGAKRVKRVTFSNEQDDEIQSESPVESNSRPNEW